MAPFLNHHYQNLYSSLDLSTVNSWKDDPISKLRNQLGILSLSCANDFGENRESLVCIYIALMQQQYETFLDAQKAVLALTDQEVQPTK
ncbi:hypothetical protein N482_20935 [Pseudoalteromonas luteoviolacea NCIMB 1942]|uniref:Uncharacterized protein n=1 Tax=Pseudoalteromonas luteoviolacea NCIMB 1942 TaxID=1365253 RepID=A0A166XT02_9GAMM|nr:hypothetical protein N482_20935 [Pseudoalteromonas luteoviolacea NCIMB 1942]